MSTLTMMNGNDIASEFNAVICILFVFGQIIVLIIHIRLNSRTAVLWPLVLFVVWLVKACVK